MMQDTGNHTVCAVCISAATLLMDAGRAWPPAAVEVIKKWRSLHLKQQWQERLNADILEEKARQIYDPKTASPKYAYFCMDFVSSYTGDTPVFHFQHRNSKRDHGKQKVETRMCGVRVKCGPLDTLYIYYTDNMMRGGANTMIEIVRPAIADLTIMLEAMGLKMPRHLILQFDNCSENKNNFMMMFCTILVDLGYFDIIEIYFLVVGHTHCPLDQVFSQLLLVLFLSLSLSLCLSSSLSLSVSLSLSLTHTHILFVLKLIFPDVRRRFYCCSQLKLHCKPHRSSTLVDLLARIFRDLHKTISVSKD